MKITREEIYNLNNYKINTRLKLMINNIGLTEKFFSATCDWSRFTRSYLLSRIKIKNTLN